MVPISGLKYLQMADILFSLVPATNLKLVFTTWCIWPESPSAFSKLQMIKRFDKIFVCSESHSYVNHVESNKGTK